MNNPQKIYIFVICFTVLSLGFASTTFAVVNNSTESSSTTKKVEQNIQKTEQKIAKIRTAADKELDKRIEDLNKLISRLQEFKNLSENDRIAVISPVNELITNLRNLRTEIDETNSTTTIKNARDSITKNYRVYALFMPKMQIIAAADRTITMVSMMAIVGTKLENRLNAQATSSTVTSANLTALQARLADFKLKIADAKVQADSAINIVAILSPDQGDKTIMASNLAALKEARSKIKLAQADLVSARKIANEIVKSLVNWDKEILKTATSTKATN